MLLLAYREQKEGHRADRVTNFWSEYSVEKTLLR